MATGNCWTSFSPYYSMFSLSLARISVDQLFTWKGDSNFHTKGFASSIALIFFFNFHYLLFLDTWVLRSTSENSSGSRYNPLPSHWVAIYSPLVVGINHASRKGDPLLCLLVQKYKEYRMAKHVSFQFNGTFVVFHGGNISLLRTKTSKPAEFKVAGQAKILKGIVKCKSERSYSHFYLLLPRTVYSAYLGNVALSWLLT